MDSTTYIKDLKIKTEIQHQYDLKLRRDDDALALQHSYQAGCDERKRHSIEPDIKLETDADTQNVPTLYGKSSQLIGIRRNRSTIFQYDRIKNSFTHDGTRTYQEFYLDLRSAKYETLMTKDSGIKFNGENLSTDEKITPTVECEIVMDWLEGIDEKLPDFIEQKYALELQLITLHDLQSKISDNLDSHLLDIRGNEVAMDCKLEVGSEYKCDVCEAVFKKAGNLKVHYRRHTGEKPFSCEDCGKCFATKGGLIPHRRIHTGEKPYQCDECGKSFAFASKLKIHKCKLETSSAATELKCDVCEVVFKKASNLKVHQRIHTGEKPFSCEECGKCFTSLGGLIPHRKIHTGERPYQCDECGKSFIKASKLKIHKRIHTGERPFKCDECNKAFRVNSMLTFHKRKHSGVADYMCDICSKAFYDNGSLTKHRKKHTEPKKPPSDEVFECDECGKTFSQKSYLQKHKKVHLGIKNYSCEHCGKAFLQPNALREHIRIHTGEKPFVCDVCNRGFTKQNNLKVHKRQHTGETPFICNICGLGKRELIQLKKHMLNMHRMEYMPPH